MGNKLFSLSVCMSYTANRCRAAVTLPHRGVYFSDLHTHIYKHTHALALGGNQISNIRRVNKKNDREHDVFLPPTTGPSAADNGDTAAMIERRWCVQANEDDKTNHGQRAPYHCVGMCVCVDTHKRHLSGF